MNWDFPRIRTVFDFVRNPRRYGRTGDDDNVQLAEATDPTSWRDQTKPTWTERLASRKRQALAFGFLGAVVMLVLAAYSQRFLPGLTGNIWVKRSIVVLVGVPAIFLAGTKWQRQRLERIDWLVMIDPEKGVGFYIGTYDGEGDASFQALKGFDLFGMRGRKLKLKDFGDDFAKLWAKRNRDPSDPAEIRVEDARYDVQKTAMGRVVGVVTAGLEADEYGRDTDLYCAPPDMADEETYKQLVRTLRKTQDRLQDRDEQVEALKEERDEWKERATRRREEIQEELTGLLQDVGEATTITHYGPGGRSQRSQRSNGHLATPDMEAEK